MKAPATGAVADRAGREAEPHELAVADHAVLAFGEDRGREVGWHIEALYISASMTLAGHASRIAVRDAREGARV